MCFLFPRQVIECLKKHQSDLSYACKAKLFKREVSLDANTRFYSSYFSHHPKWVAHFTSLCIFQKVETVDQHADYLLMMACKRMIKVLEHIFTNNVIVQNKYISFLNVTNWMIVTSFTRHVNVISLKRHFKMGSFTLLFTLNVNKIKTSIMVPLTIMVTLTIRANDLWVYYITILLFIPDTLYKCSTIWTSELFGQIQGRGRFWLQM